MENQPEDEFRRALREVGNELLRTAEHAERLIRQAYDDAKSVLAEPRRPRPADTDLTNTQESPVDAIRQLAALRDEGLITHDEFAAKKAELLGRI